MIRNFIFQKKFLKKKKRERESELYNSMFADINEKTLIKIT